MRSYFHQQTLGGTINAISVCDDDFKTCVFDEDEEEEMPNENKNEINNYYILTIKDKRELTNGFRYIKELLLRIHNFRMYQDYYKLVEAGIHVNYVKADAFLLKPEDIKKAKKLLNFSTEIGGWRLERNKRFNCPSCKYEMKANELITIPSYENEKIHIEDEWDTKAVNCSLNTC